MSRASFFRISRFGFLSDFGLRTSEFAPGVCLAFLLTTLASAQAQFTPRIGYVYPAGARQGATTQIVVGGQFLEGVTNAYVSGEGVQAAVVDFNKPMNQGEFNRLRDKMKELQEKKQAAMQANRRRGRGTGATTNAWTAADEKQMTEIRERMLKNPPNRNGTPAIAEVATLRLIVSTNATAGRHELRLGTPTGLSNPLVFHVGKLVEYSQPPAKATNPDLDRVRERLRGGAVAKPVPKAETRVSLPAIVNGQIMPGEVDRYRFSARQGQRLVVAASARALIPYLADAVPGWFQATLTLYDANGKELSYTDDYRFNPDPVLYFEIPKSGDYVVEIKDSIYRGREDFVYRIALGELPFVTSVFPLGGKAGAETPVELRGWNLPQTNLTAEAASPGLIALDTPGAEVTGTLLSFEVNDLPEVLEQEPNNQPEAAQSLACPVIVNGRIGQPGDTDVFRFAGHAGEELVAEVLARRLNSPLDSVLKLTDASGQQIAFNDDHDDKGAGLTTHQADSYLRVTLPKDGAYLLHLGDTQRQGGPEYGYRLRIGPPQPDFALRVVPASINVRGGATVPITVYALRKDGFSNEIALALKDAPRGFSLSGARIPARQDQVRLTLTAPFGATPAPVSLELEGRAQIGGREVTRRAVPAEDMMQAFAYRHLVPAQELQVSVSGRFAQRLSVRLVSGTPVKIPLGGTARVCFDLPARAVAERMKLELSEPPDGISIKSVGPSREGTELVLECDAEKAKPGLSGNLIVSAFADARQDRPKAAAANLRRAPLGSLPAIPFEIVKR